MEFVTGFFIWTKARPLPVHEAVRKRRQRSVYFKERADIWSGV